MTISMLTPLALAWPLLISLGASEITYPATVEISLLFPGNKTYNTNSSTYSPPVILAIRNAELAYRHEFDIIWNIVSASTDDPLWEWQTLRARNDKSDLTENEFQYHADGIAIVPMEEMYVRSLHAGAWRVEWDYAATPCIPEGESSIYTTRTPIASGVHWFTLVDDGSGEDFGIELDECPEYGDSWTLQDRDDCPSADTELEPNDRDPCSSRLTSEDQVQCIWDYIRTGDNETELCLGAFDRVDPDWPMYYTPGVGTFPGDDDDDDDVVDEQDQEEEPTTGTEDTGTDIGTSHRPALAGLAVAVFAAVAMAL
ncbi:hypothetical protein BJX63DRAFT_137009 [Aspergillus granulosus]|uniref:DUF7136 domain-containing protein n=1 Tax=Aspergillus granulosus TaxID=176169 RepID=A0ABR4HLW1_9EURO